MIRIQENKAYSFKETKDFDIRFWHKAGVQARFSAAWMMVRELLKMKGEDERKLRLRRTVQNIERL